MIDAILVINAGSSSLKFSLFPAEHRPSRQDLICEGEFEGIGHRPRFTVKDKAAAQLADDSLEEGASHEDALAALLRWVDQHFPQHELIAAGHRVVHGGTAYQEPVLIDADVIAELNRLVPLAPLHQPHHLAAIAAISKLHPRLSQVACFDTSFHQTQPRVAATFALPRRLFDEGVRRYGFHGLSYEYIASVLPDVIGANAADGRIVVAHLGSGASMCAMRQRKSLATTMGLTALDGLPMARRCGGLDPGVVLYLVEQKGMTAAAVSDLLYQSSGLLGASGISDDMKTLLASAKPEAREAVDLFVYRICRELGSLVAALGGLDALVFTAGIGEHAPEIRRWVCRQSAWLGLEVDEAANAAGGPRITKADSKTSAWMIPTDEDLMIARHTCRLVGAAAGFVNHT
ncbi:MAG: acetate/propionate family kinase [Xanthobacteraceae bacterium]